MILIQGDESLEYQSAHAGAERSFDRPGGLSCTIKVMHRGFAEAEGTRRYANRFPGHIDNEFFRVVQGLTVSSLGLGTYLGPMDAATDEGYTNAVLAALEGGVNFLDTSLNYRHQRSERNIGGALARAFAGGYARDEIIVATKAGYLTPDAVPSGALTQGDVVGGMHSMAPAFLEDQLERSRSNLGLETIDIFYLHNPETQLSHVAPDVFHHRIAQAFEKLEELAAAGRIRSYGTATWNGYRQNGSKDGLSLVRLAAAAEKIAGGGHHFRFIQLPFNLAMTEAYGQRAETLDGERMSVLDAAARLSISAVASASLLQARLAKGLPETLAGAMPGPSSDATRAIQFARSAPGIGVALVGMSKPAHVRANLEVAGFPPVPAGRFASLFG
jgi:aryl-alcohol dehydrogenase-like predicted oxidoreductase